MRASQLGGAFRKMRKLAGNPAQKYVKLGFAETQQVLRQTRTSARQPTGTSKPSKFEPEAATGWVSQNNLAAIAQNVCGAGRPAHLPVIRPKAEHSDPRHAWSDLSVQDFVLERTNGRRYACTG